VSDDDKPAGDWVRHWWPIIIAIAGAIASASVALYRINEVEAEVRGQPLKVARLEDKVGRIECEIDNVKRVLKNIPEVFCR
jgi:hypothetical protein